MSTNIPITYDELGKIPVRKDEGLRILVNSSILLVPEHVKSIIQKETEFNFKDDDNKDKSGDPTLLDFATYNQLPEEFRNISQDEKKQLVSLILSDGKAKNITSKRLKKVNELFLDSINYLIKDFHIVGKKIKDFEKIKFENINSFMKFIDFNPYGNSQSGKVLHCAILKIMLLLNAIRTKIDLNKLEKITDYIKTKIKTLPGIDILQENEKELILNLSYKNQQGKNESFIITILFNEKTERSILYKILSKRKYSAGDVITDLVRFKVKVDESGGIDGMQERYIHVLELLINNIFEGNIEIGQNYKTNRLIDSKYFGNKDVKYKEETRNIDNLNITGNIKDKEVKGVRYIEAQIVSSESKNDEKGPDSRPFYEWVDKILVGNPRLLNFGITTMGNIKFAIKQISKICKEKGIGDYSEMFILSKIFNSGNIFPVNVIKVNGKGKSSIAFGVKNAYDEKVLSKLYEKLPSRIEGMDWNEVRSMYEKTFIE